MSTQYKATCKCGATVDVPYSDNFKDWLNSHKECLKQQAMPRTWVGLTIEDRNDCLVSADPCEALAKPEAEQLMEDIEAKLKDKNL